MARRQVVEIICDRCKRTETQEPKSVEGVSDTPQPPELVIIYKGKKVQFDDFCRRCDGTVENYVNKLLKKPDEEDAAPAAPEKKTGILGSLGRKAG